MAGLGVFANYTPGVAASEFPIVDTRPRRPDVASSDQEFEDLDDAMDLSTVDLSESQPSGSDARSFLLSAQTDSVGSNSLSNQLQGR